MRNSARGSGRNEETLGFVRSGLEAETFAVAWQRGRELTPDEAAALAREAIDEL
jgi:hypothetical protein